MNHIGVTIKKIRKELNLNQKDLAKKCSISNSYLSQIEKGKKVPTLEVLNKISKNLNLPFPILSFLSLDTEDIPKNKQASFKQIAPVVQEMIKKLFLD